MIQGTYTECSNLTEARWAYYICNHENNVPSRLSPKVPCSNSSTFTYQILLHIAGRNEPIVLNKQSEERNVNGCKWSPQTLPKQDGQKMYVIIKTNGRVNWFHDYKYISPSCCGRIRALCESWIPYDYLYYAPFFACWAILVHWYQ